MSASYSATLDFLYGLQSHGIKLGLDTVRTLLDRARRPQDRYLSLHVGGTNGKGSTAAMAATVLQAAGYCVGLYTSPHLVDFRERIRVNGVLIPEDGVLELTERLREASGQTLSPTFFEFTTAMALLHFADSGVDVAVLEVGMGGRFDATNVVTPAAVAITNVALDHQTFLGDTIGAIAFEKAGIIKPAVPVVVGRLDQEAHEVIGTIATERGACQRHLGSDFRCEGESLSRFCYEGWGLSYTDLSCPLEGAHQVDNAACALAMIEVAATEGIRVSEHQARQGLRAVSWEGRLEIAETHPVLLLDGAHNPAAAGALAGYLAGFRRQHPRSRIIVVIGMLRDKDRNGFFRAILPTVDEVVLTEPNLARAATVRELCMSLDVLTESVYPPSQKATGVNPWINARWVTLRSLAAFAEASAAHRSLGVGWGGGGYASAGSGEVKWGGHGCKAVGLHVEPVSGEALARARRLATAEDLICVTGSLMLVGEVKALLRGCGLSPIKG